MFEFEVDYQLAPAETLPAEVLQAFVAGAPRFAGFSPLQWEEHCTECAMPQCYSTCDLYVPRKDGKCRRFDGGISPLRNIDNLQGFVSRITFKALGSLHSEGPIAVVDLDRHRAIERRARRVEDLARGVPDGKLSILGRRGVSSRMATRFKKWQMRRAAMTKSLDPDCFIAEIYNPGSDPVDFTFVVRAASGPRKVMPFQHRITIAHGLRREMILWSAIRDHVDPEAEHFVSLTPNRSDRDQPVTIWVGMLGFGRLADPTGITTSQWSPVDTGMPKAYLPIGEPASVEVATGQTPVQRCGSKGVKITVWDLDNTMWSGVLVEDGPEKLVLKPGIAEVIRELDARGIVNSVASKNTHEDAMAQLERFGLAEFMVFPQISWGPKSQALGNLVQDFNVGANTFAFIDDSAFERAEVSAAHPEMRVIDAAAYDQLLERPEFSPDVSPESSRRREFYLNQKKRTSAANGFTGDYANFLRHCGMQMTIAPVGDDNLERVQELIQRTNQMNFSGNRYTRSEITERIETDRYDHFVLSCADQFGDYGIVGFSMVDRASRTMVDLTFSCRVQSKRVEHAFLCWLAQRYGADRDGAFEAQFRLSAKNAPVGEVFKDLSFAQVSLNNGVTTWGWPTGRPIPDEGLVTVTSMVD